MRLKACPTGFGVTDRSDPTGLQDHVANDIVWQMACHMDSGNMLQGTFQDLLKRLQPAGMGTDAAGDKSMAPEHEGKKSANAEAPMRFVPTNLANDGITALPTKSDHSGDIYEYQFSNSSGKRVSGVGYTVLEKLKNENGEEVKEKQTRERPLQSNGIFRDGVGVNRRPGSKDNGVTSYATQTFEVKYNNRPVPVSTKLGHDVQVINGEVHVRVWVITP